MRILVVGAGISGLAAAWTLRHHDVRVLEATDEVGGRMRSEVVGQQVMEIGAQFLSSHYEVIPRLVQSMGLTPTAIDPGAAVLLDGTLRRFRGDRPLSQFTGGVLPWRAGRRAASGMLAVRRTVRTRSTSELGQWADHDDETGHAWAHRVLGPEIADRVLAPALNGLYFQSLRESSAALPAAVSAFGARPGSTLTLPGGLGELTRRLAERLDVRLATPVTSIHRIGDRARVATAAGEQQYDRVILAVPGAAAEAILVDATAPERRLMATPYSRGLLVGIPVDEPLQPSQLASAYGVIVQPSDASPIASIAVASRSHASFESHRSELLTVMFNDAAAAGMFDADDDSIVDLAVKGLCAVDPSLGRVLPVNTAIVRIVRHHQAMPMCPPGHGRRVRDYRRQHSGPVVLAGDYLGFPWTDSAAATGIWAAGAARA
jgi:oxygen-dependent protoporphyrinogen oxidase